MNIDQIDSDRLPDYPTPLAYGGDGIGHGHRTIVILSLAVRDRVKVESSTHLLGSKLLPLSRPRIPTEEREPGPGTKLTVVEDQRLVYHVHMEHVVRCFG